MKINYLFIFFFTLICFEITGYDYPSFEGKTEECPLIPGPLVEIYSQVDQAKIQIQGEIAKLSKTKDPEHLKRQIKHFLLSKQSEIFNNLNHEHSSGYMDQNVYDWLYDYIFDSFARLIGTIMSYGTSNENL